VGCGEVCEHKHLPALQRVRDAQVVAVADTDRDRAARVADRFGIAHRFSNVHELLDAKVADAVGVLAPPAHHAAVAIAALRAGCHVLVEKPLTLSLDEADTLVEAERESPARVVMGLHMRWHRFIVRAREDILAGAIGTPESIRAVWSSPRGDTGTPEWKTTRVTGGGSLVELGVHLFDLWRYLSGAEVVHVFAEARHGRRHDESAVVSASLSNGMLASASLSERSSHDLEINIAGTNGRLRLACQRFDGYEHYGLRETDGMMAPRARFFARSVLELPGGLVRMRQLGDYGDSYRGEWQHLVEVARGATPSCTLADGRAALEVVLAATASATRHERVRVDRSARTITEASAGE
jgi:predicted dehydrogenase